MRGLQKSKRVSWASDVNLCQVRLFLSEDCPSLVGLGGQDDLQAKASWPSYSSSSSGIGVGGSDDNLPPGFEGTPPASLLKNKLSQIPLIKWALPPKFIFDPDWKLVAGEESGELEVHTQREMRVLEAVYPRPSAIPSNPSVLPGLEDSPYNDEHTPLIPITPVEEEDATADTSAAVDNSPTKMFSNNHHHMLPPTHHHHHCGVSSSISNNNIQSSSSSSSSGMGIALEPEVLTAAYAALSTVITNSSNDQQANLIDPELLVKILSNPSFIETLATTTTTTRTTQPQPQPPLTYPTTTTTTTTIRSPGVVTLSDPPPLVHINRNEGAPSMPPPGPRPGPIFYPPPPPSRVGPLPLQPMQQAPPPVPKDINYYKSLIQQHGGERNNDTTVQPQFGGGPHSHQMEATVSNQQQHHLPRARGDSKMKINKPCIYFNSSRGCRHGANCAYQHDVSSNQQRGMQDVQTSKRMKLDREITGT